MLRGRCIAALLAGALNDYPTTACGGGVALYTKKTDQLAMVCYLIAIIF